MKLNPVEKQKLAKKYGRRPYPADPPWSEVRHGCTCHQVTDDGEHIFDIGPDSKCKYHAYAAQHPEDHRSPWNCPSYWDGCNCPDLERMVKDIVSSQRKRRRKGNQIRYNPKIKRPYNPFLL